MVEIYVDGSYDDNFGGAGVYATDGVLVLELSEPAVLRDSLEAELLAIKLAVKLSDQFRENEPQQVVIYTEMESLIPVLFRERAPHKLKREGLRLIKEIRSMLSLRQHINLKYVKAHSGIFGNMRADTLARCARTSAPIPDLEHQRNSILGIKTSKRIRTNQPDQQLAGHSRFFMYAMIPRMSLG